MPLCPLSGFNVVEAENSTRGDAGNFPKDLVARGVLGKTRGVRGVKSWNALAQESDNTGDSLMVDVFAYSKPGVRLEEPAEMVLAHSELPGQGVKRNVFADVIMNIGEYRDYFFVVAPVANHRIVRCFYRDKESIQTHEKLHEQRLYHYIRLRAVSDHGFLDSLEVVVQFARIVIGRPADAVQSNTFFSQKAEKIVLRGSEGTDKLRSEVNNISLDRVALGHKHWCVAFLAVYNHNITRFDPIRSILDKIEKMSGYEVVNLVTRVQVHGNLARWIGSLMIETEILIFTAEGGN